MAIVPSRQIDRFVMDLKFLDFEQPIAELEAKIDELRFIGYASQEQERGADQEHFFETRPMGNRADCAPSAAPVYRRLSQPDRAGFSGITWRPHVRG